MSDHIADCDAVVEREFVTLVIDFRAITNWRRRLFQVVMIPWYLFTYIRTGYVKIK